MLIILKKDYVIVLKVVFDPYQYLVCFYQV